jgi:hypothetical protein
MQLFPAYSNVPTIMGLGAGGLHLSYNSSTAGIRITTANAVGIGTTTPAYPLHVTDTIGTRTLKLGHGVSFARITTDDASKALDFQINGVEKVRIATDGKVGIATTSPAETLHVEGNIRANEYSWGSAFSVFGQDRYRLRELNNLFYAADKRFAGVGSSSNLSSNMFDGNFDAGITLAANTTHVFEIDTGNQYTYPAGDHYISFYHVYNQFTSIKIEQYHSAGTYNGQWRDCGAPSDFRGSAGSAGRVIKIGGAGNNYTRKYKLTLVTNSNSCIVTDWSHFMTRSAAYLTSSMMRIDQDMDLTENITFRNNAQATVGSITVGSSTAYNTTSDYRLKENTVAMTGSIAKVKQLNPIKFNFISDETNTLQDGFLAHEVSSIVPEAVTGEKDAVVPNELFNDYELLPEGASPGDVKIEHGEIDAQQLDQSKLVPLLTAALKEAITEIEALKARVTTLEG